MSYVLFSPIGNTDPIRGFHDGSWLHICRHYRPRVCVIYLSAEMCRRENVVEADGSRKNLYGRTLLLLNQSLFGDQTEQYIEMKYERDPQCEDAHSLEDFLPKFRKMLDQMHHDYPEDELLINVSSGTAGMKGALMVLSAVLPYKVTGIQVSDPGKGLEEKSPVVDKTYPVDEAFELDADNEPGAENRTSAQPLRNMVLAMRINELCRLVREGDYHTVLMEVNSKSLKELIPPKVRLAIEGAESRRCMKLKDGFDKLRDSDFNLFERYGMKPKNRLWQCAEYLLTMEQDLNSGAYDNMMRKLTPLLTNLFELYLKGIGKDVRENGVNENGKWIIADMPQEWLDILDNEVGGHFKNDTYLAVANMTPLIKAFGDERAQKLAAMFRETERNVRNEVAHKIISFGKAEMTAKLQEMHDPEIDDEKKLMTRLWEFLRLIQPKEIFTREYMGSYEAMNEHICGLLNTEEI